MKREPGRLASGQADFVVRIPSSSRRRYTGPTFSTVLKSVSSKMVNANCLLSGNLLIERDGLNNWRFGSHFWAHGLQQYQEIAPRTRNCSILNVELYLRWQH